MSPFELSTALQAVGMHTTETHTHTQLHTHSHTHTPHCAPIVAVVWFSHLCSLLCFSGMQCDSKVVELLSERFASGELHMPFHSYVSCVTRMQKLFGKTHTHTRTHSKLYSGILFLTHLHSILKNLTRTLKQYISHSKMLMQK